MLRRLTLAALFVAASPLFGQSLAFAQTSALLDQARAAIADGRLDEADHILSSVRDELVDRNDLDFLRGASAMARGDTEAAIAAFRAILNRDPSLNRVRLDLARALFMVGDDGAAEHHFRIARAADLPPEVQRNVDLFLDQIKRRKRWGLDVSLGIAPDSNVNAATSARSVDLFGLPFTLNDDARKKSGVGAAISVGGSYQHPLGPDTRLVTGARVSSLDYQGADFDDRTVSAHVGPRFLIGNATEVTLSAIGSRRWYGGEGYSTGVGGRIDGQTALSPRLLASGSLSLQRLDYDDVDALDGPVVTGALGLTYGLDAVSLIRLDLAAMREEADFEALRDNQYQVGLTYFRELPWGFALTLGAAVTFARYDDRLAAFEVTRHDDTLSFRAALSNRRIDVLGFTPVLSFTHSERHSNIDVYDFTRDRIEIGFTRNF